MNSNDALFVAFPAPIFEKCSMVADKTSVCNCSDSARLFPVDEGTGREEDAGEVLSSSQIVGKRLMYVLDDSG